MSYISFPVKFLAPKLRENLNRDDRSIRYTPL